LLTESDCAWIKALLHPVRVAILRQMLDRGIVTPARLAEELELPLGVVGYQMRVLRDARLLTLVRTTQRRGALVHHYRLRDREATRECIGLPVGSAAGTAVLLSDPWERLRRVLVLIAMAHELGTALFSRIC